jgi:predicted acetyltransferase
MRIALLSSAVEQKPALAELIQLYRSDLHVLNGAANGAPQCHEPIDANVAGAGQQMYVLFSGDTVVGFALLDRRSRWRQQFDGYSIVDLFIKHCYRRQGFGRASAIALFDRFPGRWEVSSCAENVPGQIFWRSVVDRYTNGRYSETWVQTSVWRGPVQSFISPAH